MSKWNEGKVEIYDSLRDNESHFCLPCWSLKLKLAKEKDFCIHRIFFLYNYQIPLVSFDFIALFSSPSQAAAQIQDDVSGTLPSQRLNFPRGTPRTTRTRFFTSVRRAEVASEKTAITADCSGGAEHHCERFGPSRPSCVQSKPDEVQIRADPPSACCFGKQGQAHRYDSRCNFLGVLWVMGRETTSSLVKQDR